MAYKGGYIVGFFNPPETNLPAENCYTVESDYYSIEKHIIKGMGPKVGCFAGFFHHCLMPMSAHTCISLFFGWKWNEDRFESNRLCRKDRVPVSKHKIQQ